MCYPAYLLFLLVSITNQLVSSQECSEINDNNCFAEQHECLLYLAPSSISGAGFGIFTTRDVPEGEGVLPYSDAPSLVISDYEYFNVTGKDWAHNSYNWDGGGFADFECESSAEHVMTFGSTSNYHTYLKNIERHNDGYDDGIVSRFTDPSAGSFSYHKGHYFTASRAIAAGEEIFADYGESWLDYRKEYADSVPREDDFIEAGTILTAIKESSLKSAAVINDDVLSVVKGVAKIFSNERVMELVPNTKAEYEAIIQDTLDNYPNVIAKKSIINRNVKWIQDNGLCLDNILPGKSTLPQVGQGAFASRILAEGSMISPVLLLQIPNSDSLLMYDVMRDKESNELEIGDEPIGKQLITNYCFGHKDSKLLLCPQSNAILINHCSSRKNGGNYCGAKGPNAKIRWASGWDPDTSTWLNMSLKEIERATVKNQRGLSFEVIATRDIKEGEEIFIDYGPNWEDAWESHKNVWTSPTEGSGFENYTPLANVIGISSLRTIDEQEENPYPDNIVNACYWYEYNSEWYNPDERGYYNGDDYIPDYPANMQTNNDIQRCDLLKKISDTHYEVRIYHGMDESNEVLLTMYPKESITFRMKRYTSDQYLPGAFRHFIEIEDGIFPEQWKTSNIM